MKANRNSRRLGWLSLAAATAALGLGATAVSAPRVPLAAPAAVGGYGWPIAPFDQAHPVRAAVGDPRTIFHNKRRQGALSGPGAFSFHNGVDIDARSGTPVYPVASGIAHLYAHGSGVSVTSGDGRTFIYEHMVPAVGDGQWVTARETVLGRIRNWAEEVHFTELSPGGLAVNPLLPGHLTPYADTTTPTVASIHVRTPSGGGVDSFDVRGRIALIADAYDTPMPVNLAARRALNISQFARDRFPVTPAALTWSLSTLGGRVVVRPRTAVDFRLAGRRSDAGFWSVYARGTFQNRAVISARLHTGIHGRYLFKLTRAPLDTRRLANGVYVVTVTAVDTHGNRGRLEERLDIWNPGNAR